VAYVKGDQVESGIWRLVDRENLYLAEVNYYDPHTGRRVRERKTADKVAPLRAWRNARKTDALRGEVTRRRDAKGKIPFKTYAEEYLKNWSKVQKAAASYERDTHSLKHLKGFFGSREIGNIIRKDVEKYVAKRMGEGAKPGTLNRELSCLKNMLRKAVEWEYLETNPAWGVSQQREDVPEFEFLTFEEAEKLVVTAPVRIKTLLILALNTGMRKGELFKLEWRDVDYRKGKYGIIAVRKTKNHETRHIPMNSRVQAALLSHPHRIVDGKNCPFVFREEGGQSFDVRADFRDALKNAGITGKHIRFHDLRHTFASHLVMRGKDLRTVAKLMGHRDIRVTMRYAHLAPEHLQDAVEALELPPPKRVEPVAEQVTEKTAG
jgi:site-specific recombinase XerD